MTFLWQKQTEGSLLAVETCPRCKQKKTVAAPITEDVFSSANVTL